MGNLHSKFSAVSRAALLGGALALGGCATDRINHETGMRTHTTTDLMIFGGVTRTDVDEAASRARVIDNGLSNPNPVVAQGTRRVLCNMPTDGVLGETADRLRARDRWVQATGENSALECPPQFTDRPVVSRETPRRAPVRTPGS